MIRRVVPIIALINRINYHVFSQACMNIHQYGFTPQKGTIDAAMEVKEFVKEDLAAGEITVLISLDVKGAFDAASDGPLYSEWTTSLWLPQKPVRPH